MTAGDGQQPRIGWTGIRRLDLAALQAWAEDPATAIEIDLDDPLASWQTIRPQIEAAIEAAIAADMAAIAAALEEDGE